MELVERWAIIKRYQAPPDKDSTFCDQQRPDGLCGICGHPHTTSQCPILMDVSVDSRVDILSKRELCFHCLKKGHTAKYCNNIPSCQMCGRAHATILHGRKFNQWFIPAINSVLLFASFPLLRPSCPYKSRDFEQTRPQLFDGIPFVRWSSPRQLDLGYWRWDAVQCVPYQHF